MNKGIPAFLLLLCLILSANSPFAQGPHAHEHDHPAPSVKFVKNLSQWDTRALFRTNVPSGNLFLEQDALTYLFVDGAALNAFLHKDPDFTAQLPDHLDAHAFKIRFVGANPQVKVSGQERLHEYHNYFLGNDRAKWAHHVPVYGEVLYQDLYPGIDLLIRGYGDAIKYDLIVAPGADPSQIRIEYEGLDGLFLAEDGLHLQTSVQEVVDGHPVAFSESPKKEVPCRFILNENQLSFAFPEGYDSQKSLVIDPTMVFSTYTGSLANNFGYTATYDLTGHLYAGGIAFSGAYPVTTGAFQTNFGGGGAGGAFGPIDMSITKFSANGSTLEFSTFLGGTDNEQPHSMVVNSRNELIVMGKSYSSDFPIGNNTVFSSNAGQSDVVVAKLDPTGATLIGSTYMGGSGKDAVNVNDLGGAGTLKNNYGDDSRSEVVVDAADNIYVAANSQSPNFPTSPGAVQNALSGTQDAVVFKLDPDIDNLLFSTYLGGNGLDGGFSLIVDAHQTVYVTGGTTSNNFPVTGNAFDGTFGGVVDGYIARLNANGTSILQASYLGTNSFDQSYFVEADQDGQIWLLGQTRSNSWPVSPGVFTNPNSGQFIVKVDSTLSNMLLSTVFGNGQGISISPTAFLVDVCNNVYISGWGGGTNASFAGGNTNNLPLTANAFQSTTDGSDLYILVLDATLNSLVYGTYVGGPVSNEHVDGGTSRFNKRTEIYQAVCAGCWGNSDFPTVNAYSSTNGSSCNLAAFKLDLWIDGVIADFEPLPAFTGCAPLTVNFDNNSINGTSFFWDFDDNGQTATGLNAIHTYSTPGTYRVKLVAYNPNSCNPVDSTYRSIIVYPQPNLQVTPDTSICEGEGLTLIASGGDTFSWSPPVFLSNPNSNVTLATPPSTITYQVTSTTQFGCRDTNSVTVTVLPNPVAVTSPDSFICPGDSAQLSVSGGATYQWSPSAGLNNPNSATPVATPGSTTLYVATATAANGCTDEDSVLVEVSPFRANAGQDQDLCIGDTTNIFGNTVGNVSWQPPISISSTQISNPQVWPNADITYYLTLTDSFGCVTGDSVNITVHPLPNIDAGPDLIMCQQDTLQLNATGGSLYEWEPPIGLSNPNIGNPLAYPMDTITYYLTGTDVWGCTNYDTLLIDVLEAPTAVASADVTICQDSSTQLFASGGISYSWTPGATLSDPNISDPFATPNGTTDYIVTVFAGNGCDDQDTVRVNVTPTPIAQGGPDKLICLNESVKLIATGGSSFTWSTGDSTIPITVSPDTSTWYTVTTYVDGCPSLPDSIWVEVDDNFPTAEFTPSPDSGLVPLTVNFINTSSGASSYFWDFGNGQSSSLIEPTYTYTDSGKFTVELVAYNDNGCPDSVQHIIIVGADFVVYVPNAFTPNGDGTNDEWFVKYIGVKELHVMIFDRWGMLIYESYDKDFRWQGDFKAKVCQEGVYTFVVEAEGYLGEKAKKAGTVTLFR